MKIFSKTNEMKKIAETYDNATRRNEIAEQMAVFNMRVLSNENIIQSIK